LQRWSFKLFVLQAALCLPPGKLLSLKNHIARTANLLLKMVEANIWTFGNFHGAVPQGLIIYAARRINGISWNKGRKINLFDLSDLIEKSLISLLSPASNKLITNLSINI
jgi:hypothetical protein